MKQIRDFLSLIFKITYFILDLYIIKYIKIKRFIDYLFTTIQTFLKHFSLYFHSNTKSIFYLSIINLSLIGIYLTLSINLNSYLLTILFGNIIMFILFWIIISTIKLFINIYTYKEEGILILILNLLIFILVIYFSDNNLDLLSNNLTPSTPLFSPIKAFLFKAKHLIKGRNGVDSGLWDKHQTGNTDIFKSNAINLENQPLIEVPKRDNGRVFPKDKEDVLFAIEDDDPNRNTKMMMGLIRNNDAIDQFIREEVVEGELKPENNLNSDKDLPPISTTPDVNINSDENVEPNYNKELPPMPQEFHDMIEDPLTGLNQFTWEEFRDFHVNNTIYRSDRIHRDLNTTGSLNTLESSSINTEGNRYSDSTGTTYSSDYSSSFNPFIITGTFINPFFTIVKTLFLKRWYFFKNIILKPSKFITKQNLILISGWILYKIIMASTFIIIISLIKYLTSFNLIVYLNYLILNIIKHFIE